MFINLQWNNLERVGINQAEKYLFQYQRLIEHLNQNRPNLKFSQNYLKLVETALC